MCVLGCSNPYESPTLQLAYQPPSGVKLLEEKAGKVARAQFSNGMVLYSIEGASLPLEQAKLDELVGAALASAGAPPCDKRLSSDLGSLPLGAVGRWECRTGAARMLVYYAPLQGRSVLVTLAAPDGQYGALATRVESTLSSLRELR